MFERICPRRGFARSEALSLAVVVSVIVAILVPCADRQRRLARLGEDLAKMKGFGVTTACYAADNEDAFYMFSWRGSPEEPAHYSEYDDLNGAVTDNQAECDQAIDILRRVAGREDMPKITGWFCSLLYSHLVLAEYLGTPLPSLDAVSAADPNRLAWARDPAKFDWGGFGECQPQPPGGVNKRWPYSSSFMRPPAVYSTPSGPSSIYIVQDTLYFVPETCEMFGRRLADVAFPSQKVQLFDRRDRHTGTNRMNFNAPEARITLLLADGAAAWRASGDANPGWQPQDPENPNPTIAKYTESGTCDPPQTSYTGPALYLFTRGALAGRDFGGPEVQ